MMHRATLPPAPPHLRCWPSRGAGVPRQRHCAAAQQQHQQQPQTAAAEAGDGSQQAEQFRALSALLCQAAPLVELGTTELGRGLVAAADTPAGSQLLCLDAWSVLCVADAPVTRGAFAAGLLQDWQAVWGELPAQLATYLISSRGDWFRRLVAWLLWLSRHGGDAGPWQAYKQLLPKEEEMSALMNFTPQERQELQCPHLVTLAQQERDGIQGLHDSLFSSTTGDLRALDLAPSFTDTLWAACMVNSRCFSDAAGREGLSLMVPLCDMANHSTSPNAAYRLDAAQQHFSLVSTRDLAAGEEVLISYLGDTPSKSNAALLKDYGFVLRGNEHDRLEFASGQQQVLSASVLAEAAAAAAAAAAGSSDAAQQRRTQAVICSLQPFIATPGAAAEQQQQGGSAQLARQVQQLVHDLRQQCADQLESLPTSIADDERLLSGDSGAGQLSVRHRAAVVARLEHKRLLATAAEVLAAYEAQAADAHDRS